LLEAGEWYSIYLLNTLYPGLSFLYLRNPQPTRPIWVWRAYLPY